LSSDEAIEIAAEKLGYLHKLSVKKGELDKFWETTTALSAGSIGKSLFTESALNFLRRQIRKDSGMLVDPEELASSIHQLFTAEAREQIGPMKIRRKRKSSSKPATPATGTAVQSD